MSPEELILRNFENEFSFSATRSSGPGGQNVNKVNTRVELRFNLEASLLLTAREKQLLSEKLVKKITGNGDILIVSQSERSQFDNKRKTIEKFYKLIASALTIRRKRIPTSPRPASVAKRLDEKRKRSEIKKLRGSSDDYHRG
jgi:ribosome-associated protein